MLLLIGIILVTVGYLILFTVPSDANYRTVFIHAIVGMGTSIAGGIFLMIYIYKKSK